MQGPVAILDDLVDDAEGGGVLGDREAGANAEAVDLGAGLEQFGDPKLIQVAAGEDAQELQTLVFEVGPGELGSARRGRRCPSGCLGSGLLV